jgi:hypothetical protein
MNYMSNRPLADMESDGVYFNENDRIAPLKKDLESELVEANEEDICHYSGLRSLSFYEKKKLSE